jgi:hypothetical protein
MIDNRKCVVVIVLAATLCVLGPVAGLFGVTLGRGAVTAVGVAVGLVGILVLALSAFYYLKTEVRDDAEPNSF